MSKRTPSGKPLAVADVCRAVEAIAPSSLAQDWDNVGLIAGDAGAIVRRVLLCIDLTASVVEEAIDSKTDLILAYHPPIFKPVANLCSHSPGPEANVFRCICQGIAVFAVHTALDAANGGTNDVLAALCGIERADPLEFVDSPGLGEVKLVVFVPPDVVEEVAGAVFAAGAGKIGNYEQCSYRSNGTGSFFGNETAKPAVGERGRIEYVDEIRLECVVPQDALPAVVGALRQAHPYEEPAFDIYPLRPKPVRGIGRCGTLPPATTLLKLARKLRRATSARCVQVVGPSDRVLERAVIVVGAAGSLPFRANLTSRDVIVTGEIRHHDALTIRRRDVTAIALGHWASERPVLTPLAARLAQALPKLKTRVSEADQDPFGPA